jgi:hypothetical protein
MASSPLFLIFPPDAPFILFALGNPFLGVPYSFTFAGCFLLSTASSIIPGIPITWLRFLITVCRQPDHFLYRVSLPWHLLVFSAGLPYICRPVSFSVCVWQSDRTAIWVGPGYSAGSTRVFINPMWDLVFFLCCCSHAADNRIVSPEHQCVSIQQDQIFCIVHLLILQGRFYVLVQKTNSMVFGNY